MKVIIHSRKNFYQTNRAIYWYEFVNGGSNIMLDSMVNGRFLRVPETKYYEFGGSLDDALEALAVQALTKVCCLDIVEGEEI